MKSAAGFYWPGEVNLAVPFDVFKGGMSFQEFVRAVASIPAEDADEHFRTQADYITNSSGRIAIDFVGRYENLEDDFAKVAREIGLPPQTTLHLLQANPTRIDLMDYYTTETRALVEKRYAQDIELFDYRFPSD